jgi:hypothetical protein
MQTVSGLFDTLDEAKAAVTALEDAGIAWDDISLVSPEGTEIEADNETAEGVGVGTTVGAIGGLLAGLGAAFIVPGIGAVVGAGWLAAALAGAVAGGGAGGVIGALIGAGVPEHEAHVYAESVKRGSVVVSVRVNDDKRDLAAAILGPARALAGRREAYADAGWTRFDET